MKTLLSISLRTVTPMTTSNILNRMDIWLLRRQSLKWYAILTLPWYQQHCAMQADIYRHPNYIDKMEFPFDITSIIQYQIDIGQLHWQKVMKKRHFDIVSLKATLLWTDISNSAEKTMPVRCQKSDFNTGAEENMPLWYRFDIIIHM